MCGDGDEADVSLALSDGLEVGGDDRQTGKLSLRSRVWLERHGVEAGDDTEVVLELLDQLLVAVRLLERSERVDRPKAGHRERNHGRGRVELHRARSEGDHGVDEREILALEVVDVPEHLGLGVVGVEHGLGEVL